MLPSPATRRGRDLRGLGLLLAAVAAASAVLATALSLATVLAAEVAADSLPPLPEPEVDVSEIDDLTAAVGRTESRSSVVVDAAGEVIGRFNPEQRYRPLAPGEVPEVVETALVAAEDEDFRDHAGFDPRAIGRAFLANVTEGDVEQGGSTITQQLAKNLFTDAEDRFERKLIELQLAIDIEERFSKDEILAAYANSVFLGNGVFGFEAAAQSYFGAPASELTLSEAAMLVGVLPAPTERNPRSSFERADAARRRVLDAVASTGARTASEIEDARARIPEVQPAPPRVERFPYYMDYVRRYLLEIAELDPDRLYGGGLRIETGLDPGLQSTSRAAVGEHLPAGPGAAAAVVDVDTGLVRALVGGRDFQRSQVNLGLGSLGGGTGRQAGSSFKPFVLATALEQGYVPAQGIAAPAEYLPATVDDPEPVRNFDDRGYGRVSIRAATVNSINTAFVGLTEAVGPGRVRDSAAELGVGGLPEDVGPSVGIGAYETSPLDMARAYAGFAADGRRVEVGPVRRILGAGGDVVADLTPRGPAVDERAVSEQTARQVNDVLADNLERGTATRADFGQPAAAKTGTSDEFANAWLVGHTPQVAAAVWVGHPEGNVPMRDVAGFDRVTGGSIPALIWRDIMARAHAGLDPAPFTALGPAGPPTEPVPGSSGATPGGGASGGAPSSEAPSGGSSSADPTTTTAPTSTTTTTTAPTTSTTTSPSTTSTTTSTTTAPSTSTTTAPTTTTTTTAPTTSTTTSPSTTTATTAPSTTATSTTADPTSTTGRG